MPLLTGNRKNSCFFSEVKSAEVLSSQFLLLKKQQPLLNVDACAQSVVAERKIRSMGGYSKIQKQPLFLFGRVAPFFSMVVESLGGILSTQKDWLGQNMLPYMFINFLKKT